MLTVSSELKTKFDAAADLTALPRLIGEWNMNRYGTPSADNMASEEDYCYNADLFPIETIFEPLRPHKGIVKARTDESAFSQDTPDESAPRYYTVGDDDIYKHWCSPVATDSSGNFPMYNAAFATANDNAGDTSVDNKTVVRPFVSYAGGIKSNKIVISIDNIWASPTVHEILVKTTATGAWTSIATNPTIDNNGQIALWYNGSSWVSTQALGSSITLYGIMYSVSSMGSGKMLDGTTTQYQNMGDMTPVNTTGKNSFFNLIEISGRWEASRWR